MRSVWTWQARFAWVCSLLVVPACGSSPTAGLDGSGTTVEAGAVGGSGGTFLTGGRTSGTGASTSIPGSGGARSLGGQPGLGGATPRGGSIGTGGGAPMGGQASTGGATSRGGSASVDGSISSGGVFATGGIGQGGAATGGDGPVDAAATGGSGGTDGGTALPSCDGGRGVDPWCTAPRLAAENHVCAIKGTTLSCWGRDNNRQCGVQAEGAVLFPNVIPGEWHTVSTGMTHTCAIKTDGGLYCWGSNLDGELGNGSTASTSTEIPFRVGDGYVQVAAATYGTCGLKQDGSVWCWGNITFTSHGDLPTQAPDISNVVAIDGRETLYRAVVAVNATTGETRYELWGWGRDLETRNLVRTPTRITTLGSASSLRLSQGLRNGMVLADHRLLGWKGPQAPKSDTSFAGNLIDVSTNSDRMQDEVDCVIDDQHDVWCRGSVTNGQLGNGYWDNVTRFATNMEWQRIHGTRGIWQKVVVGMGPVCALDDTETVWCWGNNFNGELGDGTQASRSYPAKVGEPPPPVSCTDGLGNGEEDLVDCGGPTCPSCPSCTDGIKNQDETGIDCGGDTCTARCGIGQGCNSGVDCGCYTNTAYCQESCTDQICVGWCVDADGDGYGSSGSTCKGADCDDADPAWYAECWRRDLFPPPWPVTIQVTGTLTKNDFACPVDGAPCRVSGCAAPGTCECQAIEGSAPITLDLTMNADGKLTIEAPYQDMCAPDYLCDISTPETCNVPTSFTENVLPQRWSFDPRPFDECRDGQVELAVSFKATSNILTLDQECNTQFHDVRSDGTQRIVYDARVWKTTLDLAAQ